MLPTTQSHLLSNSQFFSQIWQFYWSWVKIWIWSRHVWAGPLGSHDIAIWLRRFTWPRITSQNQSHSSENPKHRITIMIIPHHRWWMFRCEVDIRFANCEVKRGVLWCNSIWVKLIIDFWTGSGSLASPPTLMCSQHQASHEPTQTVLWFQTLPEHKHSPPGQQRPLLHWI